MQIFLSQVNQSESSKTIPITPCRELRRSASSDSFGVEDMLKLHSHLLASIWAGTVCWCCCGGFDDGVGGYGGIRWVVILRFC
jgi:hypothetical protein